MASTADQAMASVAQHPSDVRIGQLHSPMAQSLGLAPQQFCHVGDGDLNDEELEQLLDFWHLQRPNLILELLGAIGPHPRRLLRKEALSNPAHGPFVQEVRNTFRMADDSSGREQDQNESDDFPSDDEISQALGNRMYESLVQSIVGLLRSCQHTNSWITLQDGPQLTSPLLADALSRCDARPVIFVCEKTEDYYNTRRAPELFQTLWQNEKPLTTVKPNSGTTLAITQMAAELWPWSWDDIDKPISQQPLYHYPVPFATHYVFSKSWEPFSYPKLAPKGTFYVGGGGGCICTMRQNLMTYQPNVFMIHSGRSSDIVGAAIRAIMSDGLTTVDAVVGRMKEIIPFWYENGWLFNVAKPDTIYELVSSLLVAYTANPRQFKAATVVLDAMRSTPEETLNQLSQCFASASAGAASLEVGASGAKEGLIASAWDVHRRLELGCLTFSRRANRSTIAAALLSFATTFVSVSSIAWTEENRPSIGGLDPLSCLNPLSIILPAISGVVVTIRSRFRFVAKWGSMHVAKVQMESEIWKFRTNSGDYDSTAPTDTTDDGKKKDTRDSKPKPVDATSTRRLFSTKVSMIYSHLLGGEMAQDSFGPLSKDAHQLAVPLLSKTEKEKTDAASPIIDNVSDVSGEAYFECRVTAEKERLQKLAPCLSRRLFVYEILIVISTLLTTLLAALHLKLWIPVAVGVTTLVATFMEYEDLSSRLTAINGAIADLNAFSVDWAAMNLLERRGRLVKKFMVKMTEAAVLREAMAYVSGASSGTSGSFTGDKKDEKEPKEGQKKKD